MTIKELIAELEKERYDRKNIPVLVLSHGELLNVQYVAFDKETDSVQIAAEPILEEGDDDVMGAEEQS